MSFYEKFVQLCAERNIKPTTAGLEMHLGKGAISNWKKRQNNPTDVVVAKVCSYFGVPSNYFSEEYENKKIEPQLEVLDKEQKVLFEDYCKLTIDEQKLVADIIRRLKNGTLGE